MKNIPDLEWEYPTCSLCHKTVESDGSVCWCDRCGVVWDQDGTRGERTEDVMPEQVSADAVVKGGVL